MIRVRCLPVAIAMFSAAAGPALMTGACTGSDRAPASDSLRVAPPPAAAAVAPSRVTGGANPCPHTGLWELCTLERRMRQSGFVARRVESEAPERAGFSVKPVVYSLGRSRLEVFVYDDAAGLARDMAALDTVLVVPRGAASLPWETKPTLIRSGNLAVVLLSSSPLQAERLALAITAGAPQPGSPR